MRSVKWSVSEKADLVKREIEEGGDLRGGRQLI